MEDACANSTRGHFRSCLDGIQHLAVAFALFFLGGSGDLSDVEPVGDERVELDDILERNGDALMHRVPDGFDVRLLHDYITPDSWSDYNDASDDESLRWEEDSQPDDRDQELIHRHREASRYMDGTFPEDRWIAIFGANLQYSYDTSSRCGFSRVYGSICFGVLGFLVLRWGLHYFTLLLCSIIAISAATVWLHLSYNRRASTSYMDRIPMQPHVCFVWRAHILSNLRTFCRADSSCLDTPGTCFVHSCMAAPYWALALLMAGNCHFSNRSLRLLRAIASFGEAFERGIGNNFFWTFRRAFKAGLFGYMVNAEEPADYHGNWTRQIIDREGYWTPAGVFGLHQVFFLEHACDVPCEQVCVACVGLEECVGFGQAYHICGDRVCRYGQNCEPHRFLWRSVECVAGGFYLVRRTFQSVCLGLKFEGCPMEQTTSFRANGTWRRFGGQDTLVQSNPAEVLQRIGFGGPLIVRGEVDSGDESDD